MAWCSELPEHFVHPSQALITHVVIIVSVATSPSLSPASEPSQGPQCPTQRLAQGRHLINEWEGLNSQEEGYGPSPLSCSLHPPLCPLPQAGLIDFRAPLPPSSSHGAIHLERSSGLAGPIERRLLFWARVARAPAREGCKPPHVTENVYQVTPESPERKYHVLNKAMIYGPSSRS